MQRLDPRLVPHAIPEGGFAFFCKGIIRIRACVLPVVVSRSTLVRSPMRFTPSSFSWPSSRPANATESTWVRIPSQSWGEERWVQSGSLHLEGWQNSGVAQALCSRVSRCGFLKNATFTLRH